MLKLQAFLAVLAGVRSVYTGACEHEPVRARDPINIHYTQTYFTEERFEFELNKVDYFVHGPEYVDGSVRNGCELTC